MVSDESSKPCSSDASDETGEKLQPANDCSRPDANFETETLTATISTIAEQELSSSDTLQWSGFKIVGNNIDKNIRPSLQRLTHQTKSLRFFHSYAVKDRVNFVQHQMQEKHDHQILVVLLCQQRIGNGLKIICQVLVSR